MPTYFFFVSEVIVQGGSTSVEARNKHEAWELMAGRIEAGDLDDVSWNYSDVLKPCEIGSMRDMHFNDIGLEGEVDLEGAEPTEPSVGSQV